MPKISTRLDDNMPNTNASNDTKKEQTFTLVTSAPGGTLGDVSWCKKYIEQTLACYSINSPTKIRFKLVVTDVDSTMRNRIDAALGDNLPYDVIYESGNDETFFDAFKNTDAFVFYAFHLTSEIHLRTIKRLNRPLLIVNHYNFDSSTDFRHAAKKEQWMPSLHTGFGPNSLGLNIENLESKLQDVSIPEKDKGVYNLVFGTSSSSTLTKETAHDYFKHHSLFFGYINKLGFANSRRNFANPTEFAKACIAKSQKQNPGKKIDILVRLNIPAWWPVSDWVDFKHYSQLVSHFKNNNAGLTVAIYKKDSEGKLALKETFGNGETEVKIIDPFPLTHDSMINIMQVSDPFCMMTGCESFIESLSCNKLPLYHIVFWHDRLYDELLKEIASISKLGNTSLLYQYFALQNKKNKNSTYANLVDFLCKHESTLLEQLQVFKQHLLKNKQLKNTLHHKLSELVNNPKKYINQCLDVKHIVDFNDEPELTTKIANLPRSIIHLYNLFPQHREAICQDGAQLLTAIVTRDQKNMSYFLNGYKEFENNAKAYSLLTDMLRQVTDQPVKNLIINEEWNYFTSQLTRVEKVIHGKYSPDSEQYKEAMLQLTLIRDAQANVIKNLFTAKNQKDKNKALVTFHEQIKSPVNVLEPLLEKNVLSKVLECLFKTICAILGLPVIAVMMTHQKGREHLNQFFFSPQEGISKAIPMSVRIAP